MSAWPTSSATARLTCREGMLKSACRKLQRQRDRDGIARAPHRPRSSNSRSGDEGRIAASRSFEPAMLSNGVRTMVPAISSPARRIVVLAEELAPSSAAEMPSYPNCAWLSHMAAKNRADQQHADDQNRDHTAGDNALARPAMEASAGWPIVFLGLRCGHGVPPDCSCTRKRVRQALVSRPRPAASPATGGSCHGDASSPSPEELSG